MANAASYPWSSTVPGSNLVLDDIPEDHGEMPSSSRSSPAEKIGSWNDFDVRQAGSLPKSTHRRLTHRRLRTHAYSSMDLDSSWMDYNTNEDDISSTETKLWLSWLSTTISNQLSVDLYRDGSYQRVSQIQAPELDNILRMFEAILREDCKERSRIDAAHAINRSDLAFAITCRKESHVYPWTPTPPSIYIAHKYFILESKAYSWLLSTLRKRGLSFVAGPKAMEGLRDNPLAKTSSASNKNYVQEVDISVFWDPNSFLDRLAPLNHSSNIWEDVFCLMGSCNEAQVTTIADYTRQTWPKTGHLVLTIFSEYIHERGNKTWTDAALGISIQIQDFRPLPAFADILPDVLINISVTGGDDLVADITAQIAWLVAALQVSLQKEKMTAVVPQMAIASESVNPLNQNLNRKCQLSFKTVEVPSNLGETNGSCWTGLFTNSILVGGYPISRRPVPNTGLEISLGAIAGLIGSTQVVQYGSRLLIKGYNTLLVATAIDKGVLSWHVITNTETDQRISYFDPRIDKINIGCTDVVSLHDLEGLRHIVGWCSEATDFCGHQGAALKISSSGVPHTPASIHIDRLYVEAGLYVIAGMNMRVNQKQQPTQLERGSDYPSRLAWVAGQFVTFFDVTDRRAWLIDGASALLHLVRISLHLDETDPESTYDWVFDWNQLKDVWPSSSSRIAAKKTLTNWSNLALPVYVKGESRSATGVATRTYSTFEERVSKILHQLEILIDLQEHVGSQEGIQTLQTLDRRKHISGFDVLDLLVPYGRIGTRTVRFDSWGDGWIDLLPTIGVVTIFGKGFGELIRSDNAQTICPEWRMVPRGEDYLTSTVSTLKLLSERLERRWPGREIGDLTSKICWKSTCQPFKVCGCLNDINTGVHKHSDPVQFMVSKSTKRPWKSMTLIPVDVTSLDPKGAIIFANLSLMGQRIWAKAGERRNATVHDTTISNCNTSSGTPGSPTGLSTTSSVTQSTGSTDATELSTNATISDGADEEQPGIARDEGSMLESLREFWSFFTE